MLVELLQALQNWEVAAFIRRSIYVYPLVNATHIFSLTLLIGGIMVADLRMLGFFRTVEAGPFLRLMTNVSAAGLVLAVVTGVLLFSVQPLEYAYNPAFLTKITLVTLGVINAVALRRSNAWVAALAGDIASLRLKAGALLSAVIWIAALLAGRWIAFL
ncbi:MAG: DUF6644 family protein [Dehalococcoidia bacterium]